MFYGEFTEDFGGGVSQLATTTFNAVFLGGYEDVYHKPHTIYITRYPMGREATVNYPTVDLKFKNNTQHGVLIRTWYTASSITVTFYGDKEGKTVDRGGSQGARRDAGRRAHYDCPQPASVDQNNACATLTEGKSKRVEEGHGGYDVEFFRVIEQPGHDTTRASGSSGATARPTTRRSSGTRPRRRRPLRPAHRRPRTAPGTATSPPTVAGTTVPPPTVPASSP